MLLQYDDSLASFFILALERGIRARNRANATHILFIPMDFRAQTIKPAQAFAFGLGEKR